MHTDANRLRCEFRIVGQSLSSQPDVTTSSSSSSYPSFPSSSCSTEVETTQDSMPTASEETAAQHRVHQVSGVSEGSATASVDESKPNMCKYPTSTCLPISILPEAALLLYQRGIWWCGIHICCIRL